MLGGKVTGTSVVTSVVISSELVCRSRALMATTGSRATVMEVLREHKDSVMAVLEALDL